MSCLRYFTALSSRLNITFWKCISSTYIAESIASISVYIFPPVCSTLRVNELAIFSTISLRSSSFFLNTAFLRSNIDICNTFSTRNLSLFDSSLITPPR